MHRSSLSKHPESVGSSKHHSIHSRSRVVVYAAIAPAPPFSFMLWFRMKMEAKKAMAMAM